MPITITGRNQYGEVVTETISDEVLNSAFVQDLACCTREKYAAIGIDLDAELDRMVRLVEREPTFNEAMDDLRLAWGRLMLDLLGIAAKLVLIPLRFLMWINE